MATRPKHRFAIGLSLATLKNVEIDLIDPPHVLDVGRIPLLGPEKERSGDGRLHSSGKIEADLHWDSLDFATFLAYIDSLWGGPQFSSVTAYVSWIDVSGHYSPFKVSSLDQPVEGANYKRNAMGNRAKNVRIHGYDWVRQNLTKSAAYNVSAADHLIFVDTNGGSRTMSLPLAGSVNPFVVYSFVKTASANNMVLDPNGTETIDGNPTLTATALNARVDIFSDGVKWKSI